jgi:hypothetical protein
MLINDSLHVLTAIPRLIVLSCSLFYSNRTRRRVRKAVLRSVPTIVVTNGDVTGVEIPLVRTDVVTSRQNLEMAWSLPGSWSGVAPSENGIYATSPDADAVMALFFVKATMPGCNFSGVRRLRVQSPL